MRCGGRIARATRRVPRPAGGLGTLCGIEELPSDSPTDALTGLLSPLGFRLVCDQALALCLRNRMPALVVCAEVDGLDSLAADAGEPAAEVMLQRAAEVMRASFRRADVVARLDGCFAALLVEYADEVSIAVAHLEESIAEANSEGDYPGDLSMTIGTARFDPGWPSDIDSLVAEARATFAKGQAADTEPGE